MVCGAMNGMVSDRVSATARASVMVVAPQAMCRMTVVTGGVLLVGGGMVLMRVVMVCLLMPAMLASRLVVPAYVLRLCVVPPAAPATTTPRLSFGRGYGPQQHCTSEQNKLV
jgi:hypothetical protein